MALNDFGRTEPPRDGVLSRAGRTTAAAAAVVSIAWAAGFSVSAGDAREELEADQAGVNETSLDIRLRGGVVDTSAPSRSLAAVASDRQASKFRLVQFDGPAGADEIATLLGAGVTIGDYVEPNAYMVNMSNAAAEALQGVDSVRWNGPLATEWKLDPGIGTRPAQTEERAALAAQGKTALDVQLFPGVDGDDVADMLKGMDGVTVHRVERVGDRPATLSVSAPLELVEQIASIDAIQFVGEHPEAQLRNNTTRWIVQTNVSSDTPLYDAGIRGENQIVGVLDSRVAPSHCSFDDDVPFGPNHRKIVAYNNSIGSATHGTHVAGTAVGNAGDGSSTRGIAYMGRLAFNTTPSFLSESSFLGRLDLHHSQGARVHTNSWGADFRTDYNGWSRAIDVFTYENEDDVVMFAITNGNTLYTPENAKNVLAVGATFDSPSQSSHYSGGAGPTADGRRKPEIYAPGRSTVSSVGTGCGLTSLSGTSMACPAIAGSTMLARQYFMEGFYPSGSATPDDGFTPTGALLRATLINSAVDMTGVSGYPSNVEGWGRVLLDNALYLPGDQRKLVVWDNRRTDDEALQTGEMNTHSLQVDGSQEQLRVTMVFTDAPASLNAFSTRINDLDLEVVSPSGTVYKGNVFSGGSSTSGGSADEVNTVEQVHVDNPETGEWEIRVKGTEVATVESQSYGLVATGQVAAATSAPCPWDLDGDGEVGASDLGMMLGAWGGADGFGSMDLASMLGSWGPCP